MIMNKMMTLNILLGVIGPKPVFLALLFLILSVILCIKIAKKLNKSRVIWGIIGFISGILIIVLHVVRSMHLPFGQSAIFGLSFFGVTVALIWLILLEKTWKKGMKQCPYCNGTIAIEAKKCKHCSEWLEKPDKQD